MTNGQDVLADVEQTMQELARGIDHVLNHGELGPARKLGFVLIVAPFEAGGQTRFISSYTPESVAVVLRDQLQAVTKELP
jgi:hypothetical protein